MKSKFMRESVARLCRCSTQGQSFSSLFPLLPLLVLLLLVHYSSAADVDLLLELAATVPGVNETFPEWNPQNISMRLLWPGVGWLPSNDSLIERLFWRPGDCCGTSLPRRVFDWRGTLPTEKIVSLEALAFIGIEAAPTLKVVWPNNTLSMPTLLTFEMEVPGMLLMLPDHWPPQLFSFSFDSGRLIGPRGPGALPLTVQGGQIPNLINFECFGCALTCPLPDWFINFTKSAQLRACDISGNKLYLNASGVCGLLPYNDLTCKVSPVVRSPTALTSRTPLHSQGDDHLQLDVYEDAVYVFRKYFNKVSKQIEAYRQEYFGWVFHPWGQYRNSKRGALTRLLPGVFFNISSSGSSFTAHMNYGGVVPAKFTFFIGDEGNGTARWDVEAASLPSNVSLFGEQISINLEYMFRTPHSNNVTFACFRPVGTAIYTNCNSDTGNATFLLGSVNNSTSVIINLVNDGLDGYMSYPIEVYADDSLLGGVYVQGTPFAEPYGVIGVTGALRLQGRDLFTDPYIRVPKAAAADQWTSIFATLEVPLWSRSLVYDPSVSLTLFFEDPPENNPATSPAETGSIDTARNVVVIAVVVSVVVIIIICGSVLAVVKVVFPYYQQRKEAASQPKPDIEDTSTQSKTTNTNRWTSGSPSANKPDR